MRLLVVKAKRILCEYCGSSAVIKYGTHKGVQRYWCKVCKRKFTLNDALPKMKTPVRVIAAALSGYYGGMPLDAVQRHLNQQFDTYFSESGIYNWVIRFSQEAVDRVKDFKPKVGDTWIADETVLKVGGRNVWFWDIIDADSRYLLASRLSTARTTKDAALLMKQAQLRAGKTPERIITDRLAAYLDGIELVFGADTKHVQSGPFVETDSTNMIERFHGTLKDRMKVVRGFGNMGTARLLTEAWLVHYNFFKEHGSLGDVPPAVKMGKVPIGDWMDVVSEAPPRLTGKAPCVHSERTPRKQRHPKRRPKELRSKVYTQVSIASVREKE